MRVILANGYSFACEQLPTRGDGNNCLGYALRDALLVSPQQLRECLIEHVRTSNEAPMLAMSIVENCDDVNGAIRAMREGCFIPADVFVHFAQTRPRCVIRPASFVFMSECENVYTPVICHWEENQDTYYIGSDNSHYSAVYIPFAATLESMLRER
jgi:hypothetical protein